MTKNLLHRFHDIDPGDFDYDFVHFEKIDVSLIDKFGPDGISQLIKYFSLKAVKFQSGYIYQYAFVMLIGFSILLTLLLVK